MSDSDRKKIKTSVECLVGLVVNTYADKSGCSYKIIKGKEKSKLCNMKISSTDPEDRFCHKHRRCTKSYVINDIKINIKEKLSDCATFRAARIDLVI